MTIYRRTDKQASIFVLLDTKSSLFALLLHQFRRIPSGLRDYLLYICERSRAVYTLLSGDDCPKAEVQEGWYDPAVKNMEALFFTAGPKSGDKVRTERQTTNVDAKKNNDPRCEKGNSSHNTIFSFPFILSCF